MTDFLRILLLLTLAGAALTGVAAWFGWWNQEARRLTRLITRVLGAPADAQIIAHGHNAAAGLRLDTGQAVVMWKGGAHALLYPLDDLLGAELMVDDAIAARVYRGEPRRALDTVKKDAEEVTLRLIFDNPKDPDFELPLFWAGDRDRGPSATAASAIAEARTWLARAESILRRPGAKAAPTVTASTRPEAFDDDEEDETEDDEAPF